MTAPLAGIELGGTKAIAVLSDGEQITARHAIPTGAPDETLGALNGFLREWDAERFARRHRHRQLWPGSAGEKQCPDFGHILETPKPGWSGAAVARLLLQGIERPFRLDTDVNAAALAEHRLGAAKGCDSVCYVTIGTGVGGGLLVGGEPVHGAMHPELGHLSLRRVAGDDFPGTCGFHGDCIEGLVSGPALAARFGMPGEAIADDHPGWGKVAGDLGQLAAAILLTTSAERIVLGGSVALRAAVPAALAPGGSHSRPRRLFAACECGNDRRNRSPRRAGRPGRADGGDRTGAAGQRRAFGLSRRWRGRANRYRAGRPGSPIWPESCRTRPGSWRGFRR